jgi:hypothetical protein
MKRIFADIVCVPSDPFEKRSVPHHVGSPAFLNIKNNPCLRDLGGIKK